MVCDVGIISLFSCFRVFAALLWFLALCFVFFVLSGPCFRAPPWPFSLVGLPRTCRQEPDPDARRLLRPRDTSMPNGRTHPISSPTLSGLSPPGQQHAPRLATAAAAGQLAVSLPPRESDRRRRTAASRALAIAGLGTRHHGRHGLDHRNVSRRAARSFLVSVESCTADNPARFATLFTWLAAGSRRRPRPRPTAAVWPRSLSRSDGSMKRGLPGQKIKPAALAPSATAASASSRRVMPQISRTSRAQANPCRPRKPAIVAPPLPGRPPA